MNSAELKLELFRLIDNQDVNVLKDIYELLTDKLKLKITPPSSNNKTVLGYEAMALDTEREKEAMEWIEGVANFKEL